jgi:glycine/D-amino acid oxidase-like deaminating enzyme
VNRYSGLSLWLDSLDEPVEPRPPLPGATDADVAIVGGGFTGLWTAHSLLCADPSLRVVVVESEVCGFGASGRNGGWASALFAGSARATEHLGGPGAAKRMREAMIDAVDAVGATAAAEGIDCHFRKGGTLSIATSPAHVERIRAHMDDDDEWLDPSSTSQRLTTATVHGAAYTPHCAAIQPARLARGLALAVERRGCRIFEQTPATALGTGCVTTTHGTVRADVVVRATEAYTPTLPSLHRRLVPLYSLMIATEPLPSTFWDEVGWSEGETLTDGRHLLIYGQRTADDRIAFGGRGAPYHFGSRVDPRFDREPAVFAELERVLRSLFPALGDARITHRWGGPLGVPRDWYPSVGLDRATGLGWAGGYVGDGVTTTNLAGRTLADLILGHETERTDLPWVGHESRRWEPEPLRWLGINAGLWISGAADRREAKTGRRATRYEALLRRVAG